MHGFHQPAPCSASARQRAEILDVASLLANSRALLPMDPAITSDLSVLLRRRVIDLRAATECVERDPMLALNILRLVTGEPATCSMLSRTSDCIALAGRRRILDLATCKCRYSRTSGVQEFVKRSREMAALAGEIATHLRTINPEVARLAGLLHAMGELPVLLAGHPVENFESDWIAQLGKEIALRWRLPSVFVFAAVAYGIPTRNHEQRARQFVACLTDFLSHSRTTCGGSHRPGSANYRTLRIGIA